MGGEIVLPVGYERRIITPQRVVIILCTLFLGIYFCVLVAKENELLKSANLGDCAITNVTAALYCTMTWTDAMPEQCASVPAPSLSVCGCPTDSLTMPCYLQDCRLVQGTVHGAEAFLYFFAVVLMLIAGGFIGFVGYEVWVYRKKDSYTPFVNA